MPEEQPVPLSVDGLVLRSKQLEIEAVRQLARRVELVDAIGHLIQGLQRERGASSIYLASQGQRFGDVRREMVQEAEALQARLRTVFAQHVDAGQGATAKALALMAWAWLGMDALPALRAQVERRAMPAQDAVAAYSHLIAGLIDLIFHVADAVGLPSVSRLLVALLHLVQAQEEAGQERATGALLYASGRCDEAHRQRLLHLMDAQERSLRVFAEFTEPGLRALWDHQQLAPGTAKLERLRRLLCTARHGAPLDGELSDAWFQVCTERIDALWVLQLAQMSRLREDCEAHIFQAQRDLQDMQGMLRGLRDHPPPRAHAVDRFYSAEADTIAPDPLAALGGVQAGALLELIQAQSSRMADMEAELEAARRMLNERKVIERAKGILMARLGMSEEVAFRLLQKTSMDQNRRLVDVAEATLALPDLAFAAAEARHNA